MRDNARITLIDVKKEVSLFSTLGYEAQNSGGMSWASFPNRRWWSCPAFQGIELATKCNPDILAPLFPDGMGVPLMTSGERDTTHRESIVSPTRNSIQGRYYFPMGPRLFFLQRDTEAGRWIDQGRFSYSRQPSPRKPLSPWKALLYSETQDNQEPQIGVSQHILLPLRDIQQPSWGNSFSFLK